MRLTPSVNIRVRENMKAKHVNYITL